MQAPVVFATTSRMLATRAPRKIPWRDSMLTVAKNAIGTTR